VADGPASQVVEVGKLADAPQPLSTETAASLSEKLAPRDPGATQRTIGYAVGAAGVVGLVVGGYFGYRALDLNKQSKAQCRADDPNACTSEGAATRHDAQSAATLSTITSIGGGVLLGTGLTLVFTAPRAISSRADTGPSQRASLPGFGLQLRGVW